MMNSFFPPVFVFFVHTKVVKSYDENRNGCLEAGVFLHELLKLLTVADPKRGCTQTNLPANAAEIGR